MAEWNIFTETRGGGAKRVRIVAGSWRRAMALAGRRGRAVGALIVGGHHG